MLISWIVTLSSHLIWQIISIIRTPNEYGCVYAWPTLRSGSVIDLQKIPILKKIIFSHEAYFDFGGYVNKQNCCIWGTENPPLQSIAIIIGPCWTNFCSRQLKRRILATFGFKQDGATCHTAEATLDVLRPVFEDRIISRRAIVVWPPRIYDLTPLDYYLWGAVKATHNR